MTCGLLLILAGIPNNNVMIHLRMKVHFIRGAFQTESNLSIIGCVRSINRLVRLVQTKCATADDEKQRQRRQDTQERQK